MQDGQSGMQTQPVRCATTLAGLARTWHIQGENSPSDRLDDRRALVCARMNEGGLPACRETVSPPATHSSIGRILYDYRTSPRDKSGTEVAAALSERCPNKLQQRFEPPEPYRIDLFDDFAASDC